MTESNRSLITFLLILFDYVIYRLYDIVIDIGDYGSYNRIDKFRNFVMLREWFRLTLRDIDGDYAGDKAHDAWEIPRVNEKLRA